MCLSQAPANAAQSRNALDFGEVFAGLRVRPRPQPSVPRRELRQRMEKLLASAEAAKAKGASDKYAAIRTGQAVFAQQLLSVLGRFDQ